MVSGLDRKLTELNRSQLEQVASAAIAGLLNARSLSSKRETQDGIILAFMAGIGVASLACLIGISIH